MKLVLDLPPDLANARMHWRTKHARQRIYCEACDNRQLIGLLPPPGEPLVRAKVTAHFQMHNEMDWDNLFARLKWALDWLVTRGYLVDDSPKVIPECPTVTQEIDRKNKRLAITLDPV